VKVEVTVEEDARKPPKRLSVLVALAPRAVTLARVSLSTKRYAGQLVPLVRQTVRPFTKSWLVETTPEAKRFVVETPPSPKKVAMVEDVMMARVSVALRVIPVFSSPLKRMAGVPVVPKETTREVLET
jgi:hypothetical protein